MRVSAQLGVGDCASSSLLPLAVSMSSTLRRESSRRVVSVRLTSTSIGASDATALAVEIRSRGRRSTLMYATAFCLQLVRELLAPFGRAGEADLLAVPAAEDHRAPRTHALLRQLPERARHLHHRGRAADGIDAAELPRVAVIADHHPLIGQLAASNARLRPRSWA